MQVFLRAIYVEVQFQIQFLTASVGPPSTSVPSAGKTMEPVSAGLLLSKIHHLLLEMVRNDRIQTTYFVSGFVKPSAKLRSCWNGESCWKEKLLLVMTMRWLKREPRRRRVKRLRMKTGIIDISRPSAWFSLAFSLCYLLQDALCYSSSSEALTPNSVCACSS